MKTFPRYDVAISSSIQDNADSPGRGKARYHNVGPHVMRRNPREMISNLDGLRPCGTHKHHVLPSLVGVSAVDISPSILSAMLTRIVSLPPGQVGALPA